MKKSLPVLLFILLFLSSGRINSQTSNFSITGSFDNYRLHPGNVTQTEVFIVNSPLDNNVLFSSCNTLTFIPFFVSEGIYVTEDGGNSWFGSDSCKGAPIAFHGGDPGIAIDKNGTFIITRLGRSPFVGLYSHYSYDNGRTWSDQKVISTDDLERAGLESDVYPSSPFYGRSYAAWVRFAQPYPLMLAYTDDGAMNWTAPAAINNPSNRSAGGDIAIASDGKVYTCWAGVTDTSPFKEILVGFAKSFNGGSEWTVTEEAFSVNGITGILPEKENIRVNGLPNIAVDNTGGQRDGWIYIVTGQKDLAPAGTDPDIILNRSEDGGMTWSQGIRVNQDALNNGKTQYFPAIHIDHFGAVNILYYDDRNTSNDSAGVFLSRSLDGGDSWAEWEVSDHNFKPVPIGGLGQGYQGDNIDLTSTDSHLWPVWMDNSTGIYQVWTAPVSFSVINSVEEEVMKQDGLSLEVFPNPSNARMTISYTLDHKTKIKVTIYDHKGTKVAEPVNETQWAGNHHIDFLAPEKGYYFCTLNAGGKILSRKIIVLDP